MCMCVYDGREKERERMIEKGVEIGGEDKKQGGWKECVRENGGRVKPINALRMASVAHSESRVAVK